MASVLLIDDDALIVPEQVRRAFPPDAYDLVIATNGRDGIQAVRSGRPDVVLLDVMLPDQSGIDVYRQIKVINPRVPVIFITTSSTAETAIEAMKQGAYDYQSKPLDVEQLRRVVRGALDIAKIHAPVALAEPTTDAQPEGAMLGNSPPMLEIYKAIGRVAAQDVPVLITGESGTGKELVARAICQHSGRKDGPFLALNCAAIPESLLESELFGHEKGAFTGADRRRVGKFEQCNGGTILLDEIGEMSMPLQAKLLRLLQEQTFERVGSGETLRADVRILASTNRDLKQRSADDKFRSDLYYRLGVFTIHLPPLRERPSDLPRLVQYFIRQFSRQMGREVSDIAPAALEKLAAYSWPGNVRELQSVLRQSLLNATGTVLHASFIPDLTAAQPSHVTRAGAFDLEAFIRERLAPGTDDLHADVHREVDRLLITLALEHTNGNHRDAAKMLGISRQTLRVRQRALGLYVAHVVESDDDSE